MKLSKGLSIEEARLARLDMPIGLAFEIGKILLLSLKPGSGSASTWTGGSTTNPAPSAS